ncbi:HNH endonuclease [Brevundimonas bullata]|uniref:HNH endonuclease n=1 Tax=Brevundimonas bullata TaxID=13160 RepID=UPI002FDB0355
MPLQSRWRLVHLVEWEAVNGPIPEGQCLKSVDGDRSNTDPSNWQMIPRALLPRLNGGRFKKHLAYDEAAPEVRPALLTIAKIDHRARELRRQRKDAA